MGCCFLFSVHILVLRAVGRTRPARRRRAGSGSRVARWPGLLRLGYRRDGRAVNERILAMWIESIALSAAGGRGTVCTLRGRRVGSRVDLEA